MSTIEDGRTRRDFIPPTEEEVHEYEAAGLLTMKILNNIGKGDNLYTARDYPDMFLAILDQLALGSEKILELKKIIRGLDLQDPGRELRLQETAAGIQKLSPFQGMQTLEIGGPFGQVLHALGGESTCIDPNINGESDFVFSDWSYIPKENSGTYHPVALRLNAQNWRSCILPNTFDVTYSRHVLSHGSGTSSGWYGKYINMESLKEQNSFRNENEAKDVGARADLFRIAAFATRIGGFVIHQGDAVGELLGLPPQLNLTFVEKRQPIVAGYKYHLSQPPIYIFKKV